jgi:hypothetical protein
VALRAIVRTTDPDREVTLAVVTGSVALVALTVAVRAAAPGEEMTFGAAALEAVAQVALGGVVVVAAVDVLLSRRDHEHERARHEGVRRTAKGTVEMVAEQFTHDGSDCNIWNPHEWGGIPLGVELRIDKFADLSAVAETWREDKGIDKVEGLWPFDDASPPPLDAESEKVLPHFAECVRQWDRRLGTWDAVTRLLRVRDQLMASGLFDGPALYLVDGMLGRVEKAVRLVSITAGSIEDDFSWAVAGYPDPLQSALEHLDAAFEDVRTWPARAPTHEAEKAEIQAMLAKLG